MAYPNYSKSNKGEELVVGLEGSKLIIVKRRWCFITPKTPTDCWLLHQFIHVMEEGDESAFFNKPTGSGGNIEEAVQVMEIIANSSLEYTKMEDFDKKILTEISELLESCMASRAPVINNKDTRLICNRILSQGTHMNDEISLLMLWMDLCTSQQSNLKLLTRKTYNNSLIQQPSWLELVLHRE